jgi:hypothetical protein
MVKQPKSSK